jgi:type IV pilus assembly protein PilQ
MIISPKGMWEHNAYQSDNQFIVEVKRIVEDPNKLFRVPRLVIKGRASASITRMVMCARCCV